MKKDKEAKTNSGWRQSPVSFKTLLFGLIFSIVFIFAVVIFIHRQMYNTKLPSEFNLQSAGTGTNYALVPEFFAAPKKSPVPEIVPEQAPTEQTPSVINPKADLLPTEITLQNDRMTQLESKLNQVDRLSQTSNQLIAFQLLQEILDGRLTIDDLHRFLHFYYLNTSQPWAMNILNTISWIKSCKTYTELETMLAPPTRAHTQWQSVKSILKSFVRMRKLDEEGHYEVGNREDIKIALRAHNILKALEEFKKLSPDEQAKLSDWKQVAEERLHLESIKKKLLSDLSEVNQ